MIRNARLFVVAAAIFTCTICAIPTADARPLDVSLANSPTLLQAAWSWLGNLLNAGDSADTRSSADIRGGDAKGARGPGMATMAAGSCIDPLGNPMPCPDIPRP